MGYTQKDIGGGPATGLANDFVGFLSQGLNTGTFGTGNPTGAFNGADPVGSTMGIAGILNSILSPGAGNVGASMSGMISDQAERDAGALRARYATSGGVAYGTPAALAESNLRSKTAPQIAGTIGQLQLNTLLPLLQLLSGISGKGISQRDTSVEPSGWVQGFQALAGLGQAAGSVIGGVNAGK